MPRLLRTTSTATDATTASQQERRAQRRALRGSIKGATKPEDLFARLASRDEVITWRDLIRGVRLQLRITQDELSDDSVAAIWDSISEDGESCVDNLLSCAGFETRAERVARAERERLEELERIRLAELAAADARRQAAVDGFDAECIPLKTLKLVVRRLKDLSVQEYIFEHMHDAGMVVPVFPEQTLREAIYTHLDRNNDGSLECGEFKDIIRGRLRIDRFTLDDDGLNALSDAVDQDGSGDIDMDELHALLERGNAYEDDVLREADDEVALRLGLDKDWARPGPVHYAEATGRLAKKPDFTLPFDREDCALEPPRVVTPREALYNKQERRSAQSLPRSRKEGRHLSLFPNVILYGEKPRRPSKAAALRTMHRRTVAPLLREVAPAARELTAVEAMDELGDMSPPRAWARSAEEREKVLADLDLAGVCE